MSASDIFTFILEQLVSFFLGYIPSLVLSLSPVQIAWVVGGSLVALYVLWIGFVAIMHLRLVKQKYGLTRSQKVLGAPLLVVGWILDVAINWTIAIGIFGGDLPQEKTVSDRLERYVKMDEDGYRKSLARYVRQDLLADFDSTGSHGEPGSSDNR